MLMPMLMLMLTLIPPPPPPHLQLGVLAGLPAWQHLELRAAAPLEL